MSEELYLYGGGLILAILWVIYKYKTDKEYRDKYFDR